MKNRDIYCRYKIQETLYIGQLCLSPLQSRHLGTSRSSPNHHQLPHRIFLNFINSLKSLPFQRWFEFWEKLEVTGHHIWAESPGWFDISQKKKKTSAWDVMHEHCHDEAANQQLPTAAAFWIIRIVSAEECSSLMQNLMQIRCSTCSVILNVMATQYTSHSTVPTTPTDSYSDAVTVHACAFQSTLLGC